MKKLLFPSVVLAILGCGGDQGELPDLFSNSSIESSSSSDGSSSSSGIASSSSSGGIGQSSSAASSSSVSLIYCGENYETIVIGEQTWFMRNLSCEGEELYDWATAKTACSSASGHLPTVAEWHKLMKYLGSLNVPPIGVEAPPYEDGDVASETLGAILRQYGFDTGNWWSATGSDGFANNWTLNDNDDAVYWYDNSASRLFNVRCLKGKK